MVTREGGDVEDGNGEEKRMERRRRGQSDRPMASMGKYSLLSVY
jgi:hypothetical protein